MRFDVEVYLALGADITAEPDTWDWNTDITDYAQTREGGVTIRRGRTDRQSGLTPSWALVLLNNEGGRFSRLNPTGAYYGQLTKNTPLRIRVDYGSGMVTRFVGFVSEWPPRWEPSGNQHWVSVRADGVLRRLLQGSAAIPSAMTRYLSGVVHSAYQAAYWPCEDPSGSEVAANWCGGSPLVPFGPVEFGYDEVPAGIASAIGVAGCVLRAQVTGRPERAYYATIGGLRLSTKATVSGVRLASFTLSSGLSMYVESGSSTFVYRADTGAIIATAVSTSADSEWHDVSVTVDFAPTSTTLTTITVTLTVDGQVGMGTFTGTSGNLITAVAINPTASASMLAVAQVEVTESLLGTSLEDALAGNPGVQAQDRFLEVCAALGVAGGSEDPSPGDYPMGVDYGASASTVLASCEEACQGVIYEKTDGVLWLSTASDRENLDVTLALDYAQKHVGVPFEPADDDKDIRNDVTVQRKDGSTARVIQPSGPLGTNPITGAGLYSESLTYNLFTDGQAVNYAGHRVNLGTVDDYRYPVLNLKLHRTTDLIDDWVACDISSRVTVDNLPSTMPPDLVDQVLEGYTERINQVEWVVSANLSAYKPFKVFEVSDTTSDQNEWVGRLAGDVNAAIRVAVDDNDLSLVVDPNRTRWTTVADDFDPDLRVRLGGEVVAVSSIATTAGTYVAAGAASHNNLGPVTPAMYAGATAGDLICLAVRYKTTSDTVTTPTGYTLLKQFGRLFLYVKVHDGSEADPVVTPNGVASILSALTFGLRNTPTTLTDLLDLTVDSNVVATTSSATIPYPGLYPRYQEGCILLLVAGMDDDWASVAVPAGWTEIAEPSTVLGTDQGLYVAYQIQTTPALAPEGALVVTTGGLTSSEAMVVAIAAGYQTFTLSTRSVNGATKSHAVGTRIEAEDAYVLPL